MASTHSRPPLQVTNKLKYLKIFFFVCVWTIVLLFLLMAKNTTDILYRAQNWSTPSVHHAEDNNNVTEELPQPSEKLWLDTATEPVKADLARLQQLELPNVPFEYLFRQRLRKLRWNATCALAPSVFGLQFHNNYWQTFRKLNVTFQLFGAYYDARPHVPEGRVVRVLAMVSQLAETKSPLPPSYCHLWFENRTQPAMVPVSSYRAIWFRPWGNRPGQLYPHLITCTVPPALRSSVPQAVSLVGRECDNATNSLRVIYEPAAADGTRGGFAVCLKGLDFPFEDLSARLVEWLEVLRLLGARQVITYNLAVHPNISKVLRHYEAQRFVELRPLTLANYAPDTPLFTNSRLHAESLTKRLNEVIPYNDCFYRNIHRYDYIALMDVDELIMPLGNRSHWADLIAAAEEERLRNAKKCPQGYASVCVRNIHFPTNPGNFTGTADAPSYMFMLQHDRRLPEHSRPGAAIKCLHNTSEALTLHNHFSLSRLAGCAPMQLQPDVGQLHHYRLLKNPASWIEPVVDRSIYRYKETLVASVTSVLRELGFLRFA